jgi:hypothetical protein
MRPQIKLGRVGREGGGLVGWDLGPNHTNITDDRILFFSIWVKRRRRGGKNIKWLAPVVAAPNTGLREKKKEEDDAPKPKPTPNPTKPARRVVGPRRLAQSSTESAPTHTPIAPGLSLPLCRTCCAPQQTRYTLLSDHVECSEGCQIPTRGVSRGCVWPSCSFLPRP